LAGLQERVTKLEAEVVGLRAGLDNHGGRLPVIELQVAALTGQVGGLPAVHALRNRIERRKKIAAAKQDPETPPTSEGTP